MAKDQDAEHGSRNKPMASSENHMVSRLRQHLEQIDQAEAAPETRDDDPHAEWEHWLLESGALRDVELSDDVLDLVAEVLPVASITSQCLARITRARRTARITAREQADIERENAITSPAHCLNTLRVRAGVTADQAASAFGITADQWAAIEAKVEPWYVLPPELLSRFANLVHVSLHGIVAMLESAARRSIYSGVEQRAGFALSRMDASRGPTTTQRETLMLAFARVQAENEGAARFLRAAMAAARDADAPVTSTSGRNPTGRQ
jgi:hypothetical protein